MIRLPFYPSQKDLSNAKSSFGACTIDGERFSPCSLRPLPGLHRLVSYGYSHRDAYLLRLRSSEPYLAMLREQWQQDEEAALPLDLKAHYADKETHHIQVGSFAYLDDAALLKYGDINAPEHCQHRLRIPAKLNSHSGQREHPDP